MLLHVPISPAELIDKLTILEIKLARVSEKEKIENIRKEHELLLQIFQKEISSSDELLSLKTKLFEVNEMIWNHENDIRAAWDNDMEFLRNARGSHFFNDERAKIKRSINELLGSTIIEEKSHPTYEHRLS